jgi:deoxyribonuclease I
LSRKLALVLLILVSAQAVWAIQLTPRKSYYPEDFYTQIESGLSDEKLQVELFQILSMAHEMDGEHDKLVWSCERNEKCYKHFSLGYKTARRILFGDIHLTHTEQGYAVLDAYCEELKTAEDFDHAAPGPGKIPDPRILNAEHTWPQSRFSKHFNRDLQKSDLHILYPVVSHANSARGNVKFGDVVTQVTAPCKKSRRGYTARGGNEPYFEVPNAHKGNVARAVFYFSIRYQMPITATEEATLRAWHRADPTDEREQARNEKIFAKQSDRNPFIDYPELVDLIHDF